VHDSGVDVRQVVLAEIHVGVHGLASVVGDPPAPVARDPGDESVGMQASEASADLGAGFRRTAVA